MTRRQLDAIGRALERVRNQAVHLDQQLNDYPEIAEQVRAAADQVCAALRKFESARDDVDAPVPDAAQRVL